MLNDARRSMSASQTNNPGKIARFGVFELDLAAGELRKSGMKLRLQEQPLQILALLLERAGSVVTREELRQKVWPADTFVDFDHGLNTAVNKLREALGDSASSPRYVETLARRGYRFIAPVQSRAETGVPSTGSGQALARPADESPTAAATTLDSSVALHPALEVPIPRRGLTRGLFALIQVMYMIFYLSALLRLQAVQSIADSFLPPWGPTALAGTVMVTAGVGIPLRSYLISGRGIRLSPPGRKIPADVSPCSGARPVVGDRSLSVDAEDRHRRGFRRDGGTALCPILRANIDPTGLPRIGGRRASLKSVEPNSPSLRTYV
jgi:cholera toxin transcriptional activator